MAFNKEEEPSWRSVKMLTSKMKQEYGEKVDKICIKFSIISNPRKWKQLNPEIDAKGIAVKYLEHKSDG